MTLLSLTAYAATHDVRKQSAAEWKARGYLVMRGDKVDVEASDKMMATAGKGRFRIKAHGGRRTAGERGVIDRPAMGYNAGVYTAPTPDAATAHRHKAEAYVAAAHPINLAKQLLDAWEAQDDESFYDAAETVMCTDLWEDESAVKWHRWPEVAAPTIAAELGIPDRAEEMQAILARHVAHRMSDHVSYSPEEMEEIEGLLLAAGYDLTVSLPAAAD